MGPTCVKSPNATLRLDFMEAQRCLSSKKRKQHCQIYFRKKKKKTITQSISRKDVCGVQQRKCRRKEPFGLGESLGFGW